MTEKEKEKSQKMFPDIFILGEGTFLTPQNTMVQTVYVDLSGKLQRNTACLVKASEPQYDLHGASTIRLSRPGVFQQTGEVLIRDEQEGRALTSQNETSEASTESSDLYQRRLKALNVASQISRTKMSISSKDTSKRTRATGSTVTFGKDWLIYCTSICPSKDEEDEWRKTLPESYSSCTRIYRPTQFAQGLGLSVSEHIGVYGKPEPMKSTFAGFKTVEVQRKTQIILHGPVIYVDDPYRCISGAEIGWEKICSMIFVKSMEYAAQKEYRYVVLSIKEEMEVGDVFDLHVSGMMRDCLLPTTSPEPVMEVPPAVVSDEASQTGEKKISRNGYEYKRRIKRTKLETSNWGQEEPSKDRSEEVIVEETVTSPDELPQPFPEHEDKQPDLIIFHQCGRRFRFVHEAYRDEETVCWRIETVRVNEMIANEHTRYDRPQALSLPQDVMYETLDQHPIDPRFILELCLNPSVPKHPISYERFDRCNRSDIGHALACGRSLSMAVDLLDGDEQEAAAASAWYAFRFILELVTFFGPIVQSVCIIRDGVAVVELTSAPLSEAIAWATFSGTGTYTLYVDNGTVKEFVYPGQISRAALISPSTYIDKLQKHGWRLKD